MFWKSKLKGPVGRIYPITIVSFYLLAVFELIIRKHLRSNGLDIPYEAYTTVFLAGLFFMFMGIFLYIRYWLWIYIIINFLMGFLCWHSAGWFLFSFLSGDTALVILFSLILIGVVFWPVLYAQERFEINSRRLFRLSSFFVEETSNGFTDRPYSAGKIDLPLAEIRNFSRFLDGKYVAKANFREKSVYLMFSMGRSLLSNPEPTEVSYVLIQQDGSVSVHISSFDYSQYKQTLTFDQLCSGLADVIKRFARYYKDGNEARIITELKSA